MTGNNNFFVQSYFRNIQINFVAEYQGVYIVQVQRYPIHSGSFPSSALLNYFHRVKRFSPQREFTSWIFRCVESHARALPEFIVLDSILIGVRATCTTFFVSCDHWSDRLLTANVSYEKERSREFTLSFPFHGTEVFLRDIGLPDSSSDK